MKAGSPTGIPDYAVTSSIVRLLLVAAALTMEESRGDRPAATYGRVVMAWPSPSGPNLVRPVDRPAPDHAFGCCTRCTMRWSAHYRRQKMGQQLAAVVDGESGRLTYEFKLRQAQFHNATPSQRGCEIQLRALQRRRARTECTRPPGGDRRSADGAISSERAWPDFRPSMGPRPRLPDRVPKRYLARSGTTRSEAADWRRPVQVRSHTPGERWCWKPIRILAAHTERQAADHEERSEAARASRLLKKARPTWPSSWTARCRDVTHDPAPRTGGHAACVAMWTSRRSVGPQIALA